MRYSKRLLPILLALALALSWVPVRAAGWGYYKSITIDHTKVDATLTDYPLTLVISSDNDLRTTANSGHIENTASGGASGSVTVPADLVFGSTDDCSTTYDHEIETYDASTGELVAHVRIPSLSESSDTTLYMCYGDSSVTTSQEDVNGVWDSDYVGVWHMGEGGGTAYDSTSNGNDATDHASATGTDGQIGDGQEFDGSDDYMSVPDNGDFDGLSYLMVSFWGSISSSAQSWAGLISKEVWDVRIDSDKKLAFRVYNDRQAKSDDAINDGVWRHYIGVYDGSEVGIYVDGDTQTDTESKTGDAGSNSQDVTFGKLTYASGYELDGNLDEIRVSDIARSADWISTTYNNQSSPSTFYSISAEQAASNAPIATTDAAASVTSGGATLNGTVNANDLSTTVEFEYGTDTSYGTTVTAAESPVTGTSNTSVSYSLSGLSSNTEYHYRVVATNSEGTTNGDDQTFTTLPDAPTVTTDAATSVTSGGATLNGTVNANGDSTTVEFEYGTDTSYGTTVTAAESPVTGTSNTSVSYALSGLTPNTTYHYRVVGTSSGGTSNGDDQTFTTLPDAPTVTTDAATSVTSGGATLNGTVNANGDSTTVEFEYGTDTSYGTTVTAEESPVTGTSDTAVSVELTGLSGGTEYHYRVVATNSEGTANGSDVTFTTGSADPPTSTTDAATRLRLTSAVMNGTINPGGASTEVIFEWGTDTSYGSSVTAAGSPFVGGDDVAVSYYLSDLAEDTEYHYRVVAINAWGQVEGDDQTYTTLTHTPGDFEMWDSTVDDLDANISAAIETELDTNNPCMDCGSFVITDVYQFGTRYYVSVAGVAYGADEEYWSVMEDAEWVGIISLNASYEVIEDGGIADFGEYGGASEVYYFPWAKGTQMDYGGLGVHGRGEFQDSGLTDGNWAAVDWFSGDTSSDEYSSGYAPNVIYGSQTAQIAYVCRKDTSMGVLAGEFLYLHLVNDPNLGFGDTIERGKPFGSLLPDTFDDYPCGHGVQDPYEWHVHLLFNAGEDGIFQIEDWAIDINQGGPSPLDSVYEGRGDTKAALWVNVKTGAVVGPKYGSADSHTMTATWVGDPMAVDPGNFTIPTGSDGSTGVDTSAGTVDSSGAPTGSYGGGANLFDALLGQAVRMRDAAVNRFPKAEEDQIASLMLSAAAIPIKILYVLTKNQFDMTIPIIAISTTLAIYILSLGWQIIKQVFKLVVDLVRLLPFF